MKSPVEKFQGFLSDGLSSFGTIIKIMIRSKYIVNLPENKEEECFIMGNGPSLKDVLTQHKNILKTKTFWAVNYFASSDDFETLRPAYYLIIAQEVWREGVRQKNIDLREKLFENMLIKTTWQMYINSKGLIPENSTKKIMNICKQKLEVNKANKKTA